MLKLVYLFVVEQGFESQCLLSCADGGLGGGNRASLGTGKVTRSSLGDGLPPRRIEPLGKPPYLRHG